MTDTDVVVTTVRDEALSAYAAQVVAEEPTDQEAEDELKAKRANARATLKASPIRDWFPNHDWDFMSFSSLGAAADYGDGTDVVVSPEDRSVRLLLQGADNRVFAVQHRPDSGTGYTYWSGPEVKSAADVGAAIEAFEGRQ